MFFFLLNLSKSLFFDDNKLNTGYYITVGYAEGEYGSLANITNSKVRVNGYRHNESHVLEFEKKKPFFVTANSINFEFQDDGLINLYSAFYWNKYESDLVYEKLSNQTIFVKGTFEKNYFVSGIISTNGKHLSELTITVKDTDTVILIRAKPEKVLSPAEYFAKLSPAIAILFFMGFGRTYRKRFWKQFNQMNTVTLQRHIDEAGPSAPRKGKKK